MKQQCNTTETTLPANNVVPEVEILQDMTVDVDYLAGIARTSYHGNDGCSDDKEKNNQLVKALLKSKHLSIFEFADVTFRWNIPIYVARQLMRYRRGAYTEVSRRRVKPTKYDKPSNDLEAWYNHCVDRYDELIKQGWKKESARAVLPVCDMTTVIAKYDLRELFHIFEERLTPFTQVDTYNVVKEMYDLLMARNPRLKEIYESVQAEKDCVDTETFEVLKKDNDSLRAILDVRDKEDLNLRKRIEKLEEENKSLYSKLYTF